MRYSLHPEAENELRNAAEFYRDRADVSLSRSFLAEFRQAADLLIHYPHLGPIWRSDRRRFLMKRFPYSLIYTIVGEEIRILAVAHHSRKPNYWRNRG